MKLLLGKEIAQKILNDIKKRLPEKKLGLAVIQVGSNPASEIYIKEKKKIAQSLGIGFWMTKLPPTVSQEKVQNIVLKIGRDPAISGIIIQLPLPPQFRTQEILNCIPLKKDVDVLSSVALGLFALGQLPILPPTIKAIALLLKASHTSLKGKRVTVVGAGRLVGLPLIFWLLSQGATVSVANKFTKDLSLLTKKADILISATGKPLLIKGNMVKKGAVVIDAGTSVEGGRTKGDVDLKSVAKKAKYLAPVPGGVGPLTVACLFYNLLTLAQLQR